MTPTVGARTRADMILTAHDSFRVSVESLDARPRARNSGPQVCAQGQAQTISCAQRKMPPKLMWDYFCSWLFLKFYSKLLVRFIRTWLTRSHARLKPIDAQLRRRTRLPRCAHRPILNDIEGVWLSNLIRQCRIGAAWEHPRFHDEIGRQKSVLRWLVDRVHWRCMGSKIHQC